VQVPASTTVHYTIEEGLAAISLARPQKRNALNRRMFLDLGDAVERAASDPDVRGIVLTGEGPSFSAGIDLAELLELASRPNDFETFANEAQRPYRLLATAHVPTVAAVQGHALGAGFQLALACDLRVLGADAHLGLLEARYGLIPDLGGLYHLTRLAGPARAKELAWSTETIDADAAAAMGLANSVVPADRVREEGLALLRAVTTHSPVTARHVKALVSRAAQGSIEDALARDLRAQFEVLAGEDHREAVAAFVERRPPRFTGR
jgi:enoyl-CoA hydratase/carnithine racemase